MSIISLQPFKIKVIRSQMHHIHRGDTVFRRDNQGENSLFQEKESYFSHKHSCLRYWQEQEILQKERWYRQRFACNHLKPFNRKPKLHNALQDKTWSRIGLWKVTFFLNIFLGETSWSRFCRGSTSNWRRKICPFSGSAQGSSKISSRQRKINCVKSQGCPLRSSECGR